MNARGYFCVFASTSAFIAGIWSGEDVAALLPRPTFLIALPALMILGVFVPRRDARVLTRAALAALFPALAIAGWLFGQWETGRAYSRTHEQRDAIRSVIEKFHDDRARYPLSLDEARVQAPRRLLRGNLLHYTATENGYEIAFGDWLIEHIATESEPWTARK